MKTKKRIILISVLLFVIGLIVSFISLCMVNFEFSKFSNLTYTQTEYTDIKDFKNIEIDSDFDININPTDDGKIKIECNESEELYNNIEVKDNTLFITSNDTRKWYEKAFVLFMIKPMTIDIYLPETNYNDLKIHTGSGDTFVSEKFNFENADLKSSSGDINFKASSKEINIKCTSGDLYVADSKAENINLRATSGDCEAVNVIAKNDFTAQSTSGDIELDSCDAENLSLNATSGDIYAEDCNAEDINLSAKSGECEIVNTIAENNITIKTTSGDIELDLCDAENLNLTAKSGDIKGTLLSEKIFLTDTNSGDIRVPNSINGGRCEVSTKSGNIKFKIK